MQRGSPWQRGRRLGAVDCREVWVGTSLATRDTQQVNPIVQVLDQETILCKE